MPDCKDINDCSVIKMVDRTLREKIEMVTDSYDKTHGAIEEHSQHLHETNLVLAVVSSDLKSMTAALKAYEAANVKEHAALVVVDNNIHSRVTSTQLDLKEVEGEFSTQIAKEIGALGLNLAETSGKIKGKVDWVEIIKLVFLISTILGVFKYVLPGV